VCADLDACLAAVGKLGEIRPEDCRKYALERFHYHRMTADYVREYEVEMGTSGEGAEDWNRPCITAS
jgi:hypothetical protein